MVFLLAWHDFLLLMKDKKTVMILILMPIILMTILGNSLSTSFMTELLDKPLQVAIVKLYKVQGDGEENWFSLFSGNMSEDAAKELTQVALQIDIEQLFFEDFLGNAQLKEVMTYKVMEEQAAESALERNEIDGILYLPKDFIKDISISLILPLRNETEPILKLQRDSGLRGSILQSVFNGFFNEINRRIVAKNTLIEAIALNTNEGPDFEALGDQLKLMMETNGEDLVAFRLNEIPNIKRIDSISYYAAAMMSMFLLFTAGQGGRMFLEEKEQFTLQRQLVTGLSFWHILLAKFITLMGISVTQIFTMILFSAGILHVNWGNVPQVLLIGAFASLAVSAMGVFVGVLTYAMNDYKLANMMESVIIQIMAFLGGSFLPLAVLPGFVEKLSFFTINGLVLKSLLRTMQGFGFASFQMNLLGLIVISVAFILSAAGILYRARTVKT